MSKKKKKKQKANGIVYSTNPDFDYQYEDDENVETLPPHQQDLRVMLDKKARKGKQVTLITGFIGDKDDLKVLEKSFKNLCGVGGTSKNGEILIQGDFRDKIVDYLTREGYKVKKSGG